MNGDTETVEEVLGDTDPDLEGELPGGDPEPDADEPADESEEDLGPTAIERFMADIAADSDEEADDESEADAEGQVEEEGTVDDGPKAAPFSFKFEKETLELPDEIGVAVELEDGSTRVVADAAKLTSWMNRQFTNRSRTDAALRSTRAKLAKWESGDTPAQREVEARLAVLKEMDEDPSKLVDFIENYEERVEALNVKLENERLKAEKTERETTAKTEQTAEQRAQVEQTLQTEELPARVGAIAGEIDGMALEDDDLKDLQDFFAENYRLYYVEVPEDGEFEIEGETVMAKKGDIWPLNAKIRKDIERFGKLVEKRATKRATKNSTKQQNLERNRRERKPRRPKASAQRGLPEATKKRSSTHFQTQEEYEAWKRNEDLKGS